MRRNRTKTVRIVIAIMLLGVLSLLIAACSSENSGSDEESEQATETRESVETTGTPMATETESAPAPTPTETPTPSPSPAPSREQEQELMLGWIDAGDDAPELTLSDPTGATVRPIHFPGIPVEHQTIAMSPDGRHAAFEGTGDDQGTIFMHEFATNDTWPLASRDTFRDTQPIWSPDGEWIAFTRFDEDDHPEVYLVRPEGDDARQLTETDDGAGLPVWAPDSQSLAFLSPPSWDVLGYIYDFNPAELQEFTAYTVNVDGSQQQPVPGGDIADPTNYAWERDPATSQFWSADGRHVAFITYQDNPDADGAWARVAVVDLETGTFERYDDWLSLEAVWSTEPGVLYMIESLGMSEGEYTLHTLNVETGETGTIMKSEHQITMITPSPDGRWLAYRENVDGVYLLKVHDLKTDEQFTVSESAERMSPHFWTRFPNNEGY